MPSDPYYHTKSHRVWREQVIRRAGGRCEECRRYGRTDKDGMPPAATVAHHIKPRETYPELQYDIRNGKALCEKCHNAAHPEKGTKSHKGMYAARKG